MLYCVQSTCAQKPRTANCELTLGRLSDFGRARNAANVGLAAGWIGSREKIINLGVGNALFLRQSASKQD
jgi:hypothetical protein